MRTLLVSPSSNASFWSFPEACRLTGKKTPSIPLGLITVAALLPGTWSLRLVDLATGEITADDWRWAEVIMLTGMLVHRPVVLKIIAAAKTRGKMVVAGGPYASSVPHDLLAKGADIVMRGEAENQIPALLSAVADGATGRILETTEKPSLSTSPIPRFDLLNRTVYLHPMVQTSRGCPFACEFCDITHHYGRKMRHKHPSQVIAELETLRDLGWRGHLFVADDNFIGNRPRAVALLKAITEWRQRCGSPFAFATQASIDLGRDPDLIDRMTAANFGEVFIGVESPDKAALETAHKYQNLKNPITQSIETIKKNGLMVVGSFIVGMDNEQTGVGDRICELVENTDIPFAMINLMGAPPQTRFWHRLKNEGRLLETLDCYQAADDLRMNFIPTRPIEDIQREYAGVWSHLYSRERYLKRCFDYFMAMRPTRRAQAQKSGVKPPACPKLKDPRNPEEKIRDLFIMIRVIFNDGIIQASRRQYWKQMYRMIRHNPSRLFWYLGTTVRADDMLTIRRRVLSAGPTEPGR